MGNTYVKLFQKILDSTVWQESSPTRLVWITLLALTDERGQVDVPIPALAARARVTREECEAAMKKFQEPDPDSRTSAHEGRRIQKNEDGWLVLNHGKYRMMMSAEHRRDYKAFKEREYREKRKAANKGMSIREVIARNIQTEQQLEKANLMLDRVANKIGKV